MKPFKLIRADDPGQAVAALAREPGAKCLAGGTNLLDLMKETVMGPPLVIDIRHLPLADMREIESEDGPVLRLGALTANADAAAHPLVKQRLPALAEAIVSGASPQLRNMATTGGNLLQRVRCPYFTGAAHPACNKRAPGSGCGARAGYQRYHAIFGTDGQCVAVNPSDMAVALAALDGVVNVLGPERARRVPLAEFHRLPGDRPDLDANLSPDELILSVDLPLTALARRSHYLKVRDRASYAFALVSVAAAVETAADGQVAAVRVVLGGAAHKPWRCAAAERELIGRSLADDAVLRRAAEAALADAAPLPGNGFKVGLAQAAIVRALRVLREA